MIIDTKKIEALLNANISASAIQAKTGVRNEAVSKYRSGAADINNMTLDTAKKLCDFWDLSKGGKIMDNTKIKGLKRAVGDFNNWQGAARVYYDRSDEKVWTNIYAGPGQWDEYSDQNIVQILSKSTNSILGRDDKTTMLQLAEMINADR